LKISAKNAVVADVKSTTSKIKYYKTKQYSTIQKTGFTTNTKKTKNADELRNQPSIKKQA